MTQDNRLALITHPGIILRDEFLAPNGITVYAAAKAMKIPVQRMSSLCRGERAISPDTALRLGRFFGINPNSFINLQTHYDLVMAETAAGMKLDDIQPFVLETA